ncbi:MAG: ribosome small subunit-dependent GTPase A [Bacillota bacterium]
MMVGRSLKVIGGFCFVETSSGQVVRCAVRGKLRGYGRVIAGDLVSYQRVGTDSGVVQDILPRSSCLERPAVANVTQVLVVATLRQPRLNLNLLDRTLALVEHHGLRAVLCINKCDLYSDGETDGLARMYGEMGYRVLVTSAHTGEGIGELLSLLRGQITVLSGRSGVGKSSLLNAINPEFKLRVGELGRWDEGTHTTRNVELLRLKEGGYVADAPGFQRLELAGVSSGELPKLFKDIAAYGGQCRFRSCLHWKENDCAVKQAVREGKISQSRYENYLNMLREILEVEESKPWERQ